MDSNEILTSLNLYHTSGPIYYIPFGKYNSQELHFWHHWAANNHNKWAYWKDPDLWQWLYNALHKNPPVSERIVSLIHQWKYGEGNDTDQLWVYKRLYN